MKTVEKNIKPRAIIFFDGYCNLCSGAVRFILKYERKEYYYFTSLQSDYTSRHFPQLAVKEEPESVILFENGRIYNNSDAALRISRVLKFPFRMAFYFIFVPRFLRDPVYKFIARNRFSIFGRRDRCFLSKEGYEERFLV